MRAEKRFFLKLLFMILPGLCIVGAYFLLDPFRVLFHYDEVKVVHKGLSLNRDHTSVELFLRQKDDVGYDSFILGNSRTLAFLCADWSKHIDSNAAFHFDASAETLFGIAGKLRLIDASGLPIRNALLVLDRTTLGGTTNSYGHLYIKHPAISEESVLKFHWSFVKAYLTNCFPILCRSYFDVTPPTQRALFDERRFRVDPVTNDFYMESVEEEIRSLGDAYYSKRANLFPEHRGVPQVSSLAIGPKQLKLLRDIRAIFEEHGTSCHIVISPLYDQASLNPRDVEALSSIFGKGSVHDYSGVNEFTSDIRNYYESSHYKPGVGRAIFRKIYGASGTEGGV